MSDPWKPTIWLDAPCSGCRKNMHPSGYATQHQGFNERGVKRITIWCEECWPNRPKARNGLRLVVPLEARQ